MKKIFTGVLFLIMTFYSFGSEHPFKINDNDYGKILEKTIVSTGNNYRLKKVIDKIKKGETVKIAAVGGSVTEGAGPQNFTDGYAYQFFRTLQSNLAPNGGKNLYFNNAGLSGTPSVLGRLRYDSDVVEVSKGAPDLLIVEFAVNDGGEELFQWGFEAIVRDALLADENTAVIALYSAATYGNTSAQKKPVAYHYSIPQINMLDVVNEEIKKGTFTKEQYYTDTVHPTLEGHTLMNDALMNLITKIDNAKSDNAVAVPVQMFKAPGLSNLIRIKGNNPDVQISSGSFKYIDSNCQVLKKTNKSDFPQNWYKKSVLPSESFKMDINCKKLLLVYKVQGNWMTEKFGKAEIIVDGKTVGTYDGGKENGWNNCETLLIINEPAAAKHSVEVRMAAGSESKGFTIVAMGYTK